MRNNHSTIDKEEDKVEITHTGVFVLSKERIMSPSFVDEFENDKQSVILHKIGDKWARQSIPNSICGSCGLTADGLLSMYGIGVNGTIAVAKRPGGNFSEDVDQSDRGPNFSETLRCVKIIDGLVHVAGMARQVYRRLGDNNWTAIDEGTYQPRGTRTKATGFLDIAGTSLSDIYAVGYKGEIWHFDGKDWSQNESPTNVALSSVLAASDGNVYIAGLMGTLLRGRNNAWEPLAQGQQSDDFWGLAEFNGKIYVATRSALFTLDDGDLVPVDFGTGTDVTTSYLHSNDGVLYSVGEKDICYTENGKDWIFPDIQW